jgi:hypothetical protein
MMSININQLRKNRALERLPTRVEDELPTTAVDLETNTFLFSATPTGHLRLKNSNVDNQGAAVSLKYTNANEAHKLQFTSQSHQRILFQWDESSIGLVAAAGALFASIVLLLALCLWNMTRKKDLYVEELRDSHSVTSDRDQVSIPNDSSLDDALAVGASFVNPATMYGPKTAGSVNGGHSTNTSSNVRDISKDQRVVSVLQLSPSASSFDVAMNELAAVIVETPTQDALLDNYAYSYDVGVDLKTNTLDELYDDEVLPESSDDGSTTSARRFPG